MSNTVNERNFEHYLIVASLHTIVIKPRRGSYAGVRKKQAPRDLKPIPFLSLAAISRGHRQGGGAWGTNEIWQSTAVLQHSGLVGPTAWQRPGALVNTGS
jgi:hypothetical protein